MLKDDYMVASLATAKDAVIASRSKG